MVKRGVKTDSDVPCVFINGLSKEVKEKTIKRLTNSGFTAGE